MTSRNTPHPSSSARAHRLTRTAGIVLALVSSPVLLASCAQAEASNDEPELEARLALLEAKEEIRSVVLAFARIVDDADVSALRGLEPRLHASFVMDVVDFDGHEYQFVGFRGLVEDYGPIMVSAQANLAVSAIAVDIDGDHATASFKFVNSVQPPPELGVEVGEKVLLMADNTATFIREDGMWKLASLELVHSLAYPGSLPGG
jgi:hypothetical protein